MEGAVLTNNVRLGLSRSRFWQHTCCGITAKWRWCLDRSSPISVRCALRSMRTEKSGPIIISCHRFVVGFVVVDHVILVKCTFHCLSVAQFAQLNPETGQSFQQHLAEHLCDVVQK